MTLYEIDAKIMGLVDPETGEVADFEAFGQLQLERGKKIENIALYIKNLTAEAVAVRAEAKTLIDRAKGAESTAKRLERLLMYALDGEKFSTAKCAVSWRKSNSVQIENEENLVAWLRRNGMEDCLKFSEPTVSKSAVGDLLKSGIEVPGARIVVTNNMTIK